jgi:hypothetical protein
MADHPFIGTLSVTDKIGIGTENPIAQLHISSSTAAPSQAFLESGGALLKLSVDASGAKLGTDNAFSLSILTDGSPRMAIDAAGNVGIGTTPTIAEKLTVNGNLKATSFLGNGATLDGIVKKAGDTMTGPLTIQNTLTVSGGAITPATGNSENAGIMFPKNPGGGSGDAAWIRYYPRTGEATTLEIGTSSDNNDHIALIASGNVGIGTNQPQGKLDVRGDIRAGNSDIYFTKTDHNHTGIGNTAGFAAIENTASHDALMILGRAGTSKGRSVKLWDYLQVNGDLEVTGNIAGRVTGIGFASASLSHGQMIPVPTGFTREECVFFAAIKFLNIPTDGNRFIANCTVDQTGKVSVSDDSRVMVAGLAIAKKGGW